MKNHSGDNTNVSRRNLLKVAIAAALTGSVAPLPATAAKTRRPARKLSAQPNGASYYYVANSKSIGLREAGPSSSTGHEGDWDDPANLYANFNSAYAEWLANGGANDSIVFDDGNYVIFDDVSRIVCDGDKSDALVINSRSKSRLLCTVTTADGEAGAFRSRPATTGQPLVVRNIGFTASANQTAHTSRQIEVSAASGSLRFEDCAFSGIVWTANTPHFSGALAFQDASVALVFERCLFADLTITGGSRPFVSLHNSLNRFTDCEWCDCANTCTAAGGGSAYVVLLNTASLMMEGGLVRANRVASTRNEGTTGFCENRGSGTFTADGVDISHNVYYNTTLGDTSNIRGGFFSDSAGAQSSQAHLVTRCRFFDNEIIVANNRLGGLVLSRAQGSRVTVIDCEAFDNKGWYGALAYCSAGGSLDVRRCRGYRNRGGARSFNGVPINGISLYIGGGASDCTVENVALYGHTDLVRGNALYIHNSNTPAQPGPRTVTMKHVVVFDNISDPYCAAAKVATSEQPLTVSWINCVFDNLGPADLDLADSSQTLTVSYQHCFFRQPMLDGNCDNVIGDAPAQLASLSTLSGSASINARGRPTLGSALLWSGVNCGVVSDVNGDPYPSPTHMGAYAKPAPHYGPERL